MIKNKIKIFEGDCFGIENMYAEWQADGINKTIIKTELHEFGVGSQCKKVLIIYYEVWEDYYGG
jgi:hypothetical protein